MKYTPQLLHDNLLRVWCDGILLVVNGSRVPKARRRLVGNRSSVLLAFHLCVFPEPYSWSGTIRAAQAKHLECRRAC